MNAINLYALARVEELDTFVKFEKQLSKRDKLLRFQQHEMDSVVSFVDFLFFHSRKLDIYNNFYFSYSIPQIGKEFDLLRINDEVVINIELKSEAVEEDDINRYFGVSNFLVSPLNTPDIFLQRAYFLTQQQEKFKKEILDSLYVESEIQFIGLTGAAGTGKTLLLYDIALECAGKNKCLLIHCGQLSEGHIYLDKNIPELEIIPASLLKYDFDYTPYGCIFIDESHRIYENQFDEIISYAKAENIPVVLSYDLQQVLSKSEREADIPSKIENLENCEIYELSNKIRTNKELASFIKQIMKINLSTKLANYPSVSVCYVDNVSDCKRFIAEYYEDYQYINFTQSRYNYGEFDVYGDDGFNTHKVIGQEFDNVLMLMGQNFRYNEEKRLIGADHPYPNYLYTQLFYQGITRAREKLAIIIIENKQLFEDILSILQ